MGKCKHEWRQLWDFNAVNNRAFPTRQFYCIKCLEIR